MATLAKQWDNSTSVAELFTMLWEHGLADKAAFVQQDSITAWILSKPDSLSKAQAAQDFRTKVGENPFI